MKHSLRWPSDQLGQAVDALVSHLAGRVRGQADRRGATGTLAAFVHKCAASAGLVAEPAELMEQDVAPLLRRCPPSLLRMADGSIVCLVGRAGRSVRVLTADGQVVSRSVAVVDALLREDAATRAHALAASLQAQTPELRGLTELHAALRRQMASGVVIATGFTFRENIGLGTRRMLGSLQLPTRLTRLLAISIAQSALGMGAWALVGTLALRGHAELGNLTGWALLSLTTLVLQIVATRYVGRFTVQAATRLRMRLLEGALALESDELGAFGLGGLMVISTQADQFLNAILSMFLAVLATVTSVGSTLVLLAVAPQTTLSVALFAGGIVLVCVVAPYFFRASAAQQRERVRLTTEMVERMLGHRTRLVQQTPKSWHEGEDESLEGYAARLARFDRATTLLRGVPRAYFLVSLSAVFFVLVGAPSQEALALVLGGISLGMASLSSLCEVVVSGGELVAQWKCIAPVVREPQRAHAPIRMAITPIARGEKVLELRSVRFAYPGRERPVLDAATLTILQGDRMLIEGPSGGGKTTLAALLAGLRQPSSGLVLVKGVDHHTLSELDLRRAVASAPQFYKNHVFTGSLAFNLLLGRHWPPEPEDLRDARAVCNELGLGPLVDRMPGGLFQQVGETGWQLSHGERSRVFLARTLLQGADVVLLDETFGALDPATLTQCMATCMRRSPTLLVITHR